MSQPYKTAQPPPADAKLVYAAVRMGEVVYVGWRHSDAIQAIIADRGKADRLHIASTVNQEDNQGFLDQYGNYYNRFQSARIAYKAKQIKKINGTLFSEELWDVFGEPNANGGLFDPGGDRKAIENLDPAAYAAWAKKAGAQPVDWKRP